MSVDRNGKPHRAPGSPQGGQFAPKANSAPRELLNRSALSREDVASTLGELVTELKRRGVKARIQVVGGSAIFLLFNPDRGATVDIDALPKPREEVLLAAEAVRRVRPGLGDDWFNDAAAQFVPTGFGRAPEWIRLVDEGDVVIEVGSAEMLLAMKLHATQRRGRRDAMDLPVLLAAAGVGNADHAEQLYGEFYPGDELSPRTYAFVEDAIGRGLPAVPDITAKDAGDLIRSHIT